MKKETFIKLGLFCYVIAILGSQLLHNEWAYWFLVPSLSFSITGFVLKIKEEKQADTFKIKSYLPVIIGVFTCICIFGYFYFSV